MKKEKQIINQDVAVEKDYRNLLNEVKSLLEKGLYTAYKAVDNIKVQTYWQIGERIVREELKNKGRADYGRFLIKNLSHDLGIEKKLLYRIIKFYNAYPIVASVMRQLSWTHYYCLVDIKDDKKRNFYQNKAVQHSWSVRELRQQIKSQLYEKISPEEIQATAQNKLPAIEAPEVFKDIYDFDFLQLKANDTEEKMEQELVKNFEAFLGELGEDFFISKRQTPIKIDNQTHYIDLVLYHRGIPCVILVDLKIGKLDSRDIGQMNKYIAYWRRNRQYEHEKPTIGLIICKDAGKEEVMYALEDLEKKIFIATYKGKLPSEDKIKKAIKELT